MIREKRYRRLNNTHSNRNHGLVILNVLLIATLILGFNKLQQEKIIQRFVAEYGFYGQSLSLTKDQKFIHRYFGCSQSNGIEKGNYLIKNDTLILKLTAKNEAILSEMYLIDIDKLIPVDSGQIFSYVPQYGNW